MGERKRPLTKEEVEAYKREKYDANYDKLIRQRIGACDRMHKGRKVC